jgi:hypothetical protein
MHPDLGRQSLYQLELWLRNDLLGRGAAATTAVLDATRARSVSGLLIGFGHLARALGCAAAGGVGALLAILMLVAGRYRALDADEARDARAVFGDALDTSNIFVSTDCLAHRLIFGFQRRCMGWRRAFVTNNLVHAPASPPLPRHVFIHELTHVWQAMVTGPSYMCAAVCAQLWGGGYNYGYEDDPALRVRVPIDHRGDTALMARGEALGEGAERVLETRSFDQFNPEQQGQIVMHYFVRQVLLGLPHALQRPWARHVEHVRTALAHANSRARAT